MTWNNQVIKSDYQYTFPAQLQLHINPYSLFDQKKDINDTQTSTKW